MTTPNLYLVGGTVRDILLGRTIGKDIDIAVEASSYQEMKDYVLSRGFVIWQEREQFGTFRGAMPRACMFEFNIPIPESKRDVVDVDFTLCRTECGYADHRHPTSVSPGTIYDDLKRRDFTVNAVAMGQKGILIDPHDGFRDAGRKILKCVGNPWERLDEDALRILRALRFMVTHNLEPVTGLIMALTDKNLVASLNLLPLERIYGEIEKMFAHDTNRTLQLFGHYSSIRDACFSRTKLRLKPTLEAK